MNNCSIEERINDLVYARVEDLGRKMIKEEEYKSLEKEAFKILNEIEEYLPAEKRHLLGDLEEYNTLQVAFVEAYVYKQGLKDGFKVNSLL